MLPTLADPSSFLTVVVDVAAAAEENQAVVVDEIVVEIHQYEIVPASGKRIVFAGIYLTRYTDAMTA